MRVLVAIDGSPAADVARDLVAALPWTAEDEIRLMTVVNDSPVLIGTPWVGLAISDSGELDRQLVAAGQAAVDRALTSIAPNVAAQVQVNVKRGRPPSTIVDEAAALGAELIVLGSRGLGPFRAALLGSVAAEVVDHAPCPVLIARRATLVRILLADDGSDAAGVARRTIAGPPFAGRPVRVVSVAAAPPPWQAAVSPAATELALAAWDESLRIQREDHERIVATAARELEAAGSPAETAVRVGDAAGEIVAAATEWGADLVAMGTHGRTALQRILVGSVARNVAQHAPCSVLVARAPAPGPGGGRTAAS